MAHDFQVVVDTADPHVLADWWAETLGWPVEPTDEDFIREMIAKGYAKEEETRTYNGSLVWRTGAAIRHPDSPPDGPPRRILFQEVPEPKTARGAKFLWRGRQGPHSWVTVADPEGNEFCIS
jgi:hypothetical protein